MDEVRDTTGNPHKRVETVSFGAPLDVFPQFVSLWVLMSEGLDDSNSFLGRQPPSPTDPDVLQLV